MFDSVRGAENALFSDRTDAEVHYTDTHLTSFDPDGFTVKGGSAASNQPGDHYISWNFKAGGPAVTNNDGSIPTEVSANKDMGFSVVKYSGTGSQTTVGHGLGQPLSLVITKKIGYDGGNNQNWIVGSSFLGKGETLELNGDGGVSSIGAYSDPISSSTAINYLSNNNVNKSGFDYIAYCFTNTEMLQVGKYLGNGSAEGPFVNLPFQPAYFMVKSASAADRSWTVWDNARDPYNRTRYTLYPNSDMPETDSSSLTIDLLSNGVKIDNDHTWVNTVGVDYIYLAISEQSFKNSRGR